MVGLHPCRRCPTCNKELKSFQAMSDHYHAVHLRPGLWAGIGAMERMMAMAML